MSANYTEANYENSVIELFRNDLGYEYVYGPDIERDFYNPLYEDVLLDSLYRLNRDLPDDAIQDALFKLKNFENGELVQKNAAFMDYLQNGIPVRYFVAGEERSSIVYLVDYKNPDNNSFIIANQWTFIENSNKRPDVILFLNGLPIVLVELKSPSREETDASEAYRQLRNYMQEIPSMFIYNAICVMSDQLTSKAGTITSGEDRFMEWKTKDGDYENTQFAQFDTFFEGMFKKERLLDIIKNFICFSNEGINSFKILAGYHQYFAVRKAIESTKRATVTDGKGGVFWHTQGSGKSLSMVFYAHLLQEALDSPTIVVITDRNDLDDQLYGQFAKCKEFLRQEPIHAESRENLKSLLAGRRANGIIFTTMQKFEESFECLSERRNIIVMADEAHRSQYGIFADNMMKLLPTAARMGFTGTPLLSSDNITARTFGGYVSVYDFKRAVEDGATVPLYYENRGEKILDLHNPEITEQILDAIENADLDVDQQDKLEAEFAKEIHLMTAEPRLKSIARDFVNHYSDLWTSGKAMFVCLNKVTCVRMYNYVQEYWKEEIKQLKAKIKTATQQEAQELERKLKWMQETEMAVVISQEQNEIQTFKKWNLDIKYHRTKMEKRELDKEFKNSKNPLRVVFVCAMWLTGFDVKCLSCLYLDKPLKAHTLMQTIARANRVSEGKSNGLIVDYIGIVKALRKALADYTANVGGNGGTDPTVDKEKLIARIIETIEKAKSFLADNDFDLQMLIDAYDFQKLSYLQEAANAVCGTIEDKKTFTTYASELNRLMKYTDRDDITGHTRKEYEAIAAIYAELQKKRKHINTTDLMVEINAIISSYVEIQHMPSMVREEPRRFDISAIDFDLLRREFAKVKKKNLVLKDLEEVIQQKLDRMMFCNPDRINYYERYQQIIDDYNSEQDRATIEKTFMDLMDLANQMNQEEQRYVREGFSSDEELSFYDMLFRDDLSKNDIKKLKEVAADLLHKIKDKISELDHWTDKQETKAAVDNLIRDTLWAELPECYDEVSISGYRQKIYEYVYTRYKEVA